jgi:hypothetical protein
MTARRVRDVTADEIRAWPATVDLVTGLAPFGVGRDGAYRLAASGDAPVPVLKIGRRLRVSRSAVMTALGILDVPHNGTGSGGPAEGSAA